MTREWQEAMNERALEKKHNPITGSSSLPPLNETHPFRSFQVSHQKDTKAKALSPVNKHHPRIDVREVRSSLTAPSTKTCFPSKCNRHNNEISLDLFLQVIGSIQSVV